MLNRPATKIELKLEEDIVEYEETKESRKNYLKNVSVNKNDFDFESLTPESYKNSMYYPNSNTQFSIERSPYGQDTPNNK
jgi:hypothetical protein